MIQDIHNLCHEFDTQHPADIFRSVTNLTACGATIALRGPDHNWYTQPPEQPFGWETISAFKFHCIVEGSNAELSSDTFEFPIAKKLVNDYIINLEHEAQRLWMIANTQLIIASCSNDNIATTLYLTDFNKPLWHYRDTDLNKLPFYQLLAWRDQFTEHTSNILDATLHAEHFVTWDNRRYNITTDILQDSDPLQLHTARPTPRIFTIHHDEKYIGDVIHAPDTDKLAWRNRRAHFKTQQGLDTLINPSVHAAIATHILYSANAPPIKAPTQNPTHFPHRPVPIGPYILQYRHWELIEPFGLDI
jgi:hypothetical protein